MMPPDHKHQDAAKLGRLQFGLPVLFVLTTVAAIGVAYPNAYRTGFLLLGCGCVGIAAFRVVRIVLTRSTR